MGSDKSNVTYVVNGVTLSTEDCNKLHDRIFPESPNKKKPVTENFSFSTEDFNKLHDMIFPEDRILKK